MTCDVAVIGAGAAGIAAARLLAAHGKRVVVLEAGARLGGRAFTDAAGVDHGASWLHDAAVNPLTPLAQALGFTVHDQGERRKLGLHVAGRPASAEERGDYLRAIEAAEAAFEAAVAAGGADRDCVGLVPAGPWRDSVAHWLGSIINGAALSGISLRDYVAIDLHGLNWQLAEGLGTLVARLGAGLDVRLATPVRRVLWGGADVALETPAGTLRAGAVLVTVSTGVLAGEGLRFTPALPVEIQAAVQGLPLGLLSKLALRLVPGVLELPAFGRLERQAESATDAPVNFMLRPFGRDQVVAFFGGALAWDLAKAGPAAAAAHCRAELARFWGAEAVARGVAPGGVATRWGTDPLFGGAYTHARPGAAGARAVLREAALAGGRLRFAGEACHPTHAATLGGAWASGEAAARAMLGLA